MRRFYLYQHNGYYYAHLLDPVTGVKLPARSTKTKDRDEALMIVSKWLETGLPSGRGKNTVDQAAELESLIAIIKKADIDTAGALRIVRLLKGRGLVDIAASRPGAGGETVPEFLEWFWDYEKSSYVAEKLAHGQRISRSRCREMTLFVRRYWTPFFTGKLLRDVVLKDLKAFSLRLAARREKERPGRFVEKLAAGTINSIMLAGTTALAWAYRDQRIGADPTAGLMRFSVVRKKRGVLTPQEAQRVFSRRWEDKRAFAGNLLAITTGMRQGEILALRHSDIQPDAGVLNVRHSWNMNEGLKSTKTGEERTVPLYPEVRQLLQELIAENPYDADDPFVFYSLLPDKPMDPARLLDNLKKACAAAGVDAKARNIVFHSHRHYYAARMVDRMRPEEVKRITGHRSGAVFEEYADHVIAENLEEARKVGADVFGDILAFAAAA